MTLEKLYFLLKGLSLMNLLEYGIKNINMEN